MWLLDTNIISELRKPNPDPNVMSWMQSQKSETLHTSEVCLAEIKSGINAQPDSDKRQLLKAWFENAVYPLLDGRIVPVTQAVLVGWLELITKLHARREAAPPADLLIAASALDRGLYVVTRDASPFIACGIKTLNPFTGERFNGA